MSKVKIENAKVDGVKADFVKGEVKITLRISLEDGLANQGDLAEMAEGDQPVTVEIRPFQTKIPGLESLAQAVRNGEVTISSHGGNGS